VRCSLIGFTSFDDYLSSIMNPTPARARISKRVPSRGCKGSGSTLVQSMTVRLDVSSRSEDKLIIEKQQKLLQENPDFEPRGIGGDKALRILRDKWDEKLKQETESQVSARVNLKAMI